MVHYSKLKKGKVYKLDDIVVGKFIRSEGDELVFLESEFGDSGENNISKDENDDFIEVPTKKLPKSYFGSGKLRHKKTKSKHKPKTKTKRKQKSRKS